MLSDLDIFRAAHLMMYEHGGDPELEAAMSADRMLRRGDREELLTWFRIGLAIKVMRQVPQGLPHRPNDELKAARDEPLHDRVARAQPERSTHCRSHLRRPRHRQGHPCRRAVLISLERHPSGGASPDRRRALWRARTGAVDRRANPPSLCG